MSVFAIGDLHLSFGEKIEKPMDIYGAQWVNHTQRVKENWVAVVKETDTVVLPGDMSWGLRLEEAIPDLEWIHQLPGQKVFIKGNHDLWWSSLTKLARMASSLHFVQNQSYEGKDFLICGSRGWICPGASDFSTKDQKIYERELGRLKLSLEAGKKIRDRAAAEGRELTLLGALHFPPTNERMEHSGFTELFSQYETAKVVYGHLHGAEAYKNGFQGIRGGTEYILTSCDKLSCNPLKLLD